jgi:hypothetical protein
MVMLAYLDTPIETREDAVRFFQTPDARDPTITRWTIYPSECV